MFACYTHVHTIPLPRPVTAVQAVGAVSQGWVLDAPEAPRGSRWGIPGPLPRCWGCAPSSCPSASQPPEAGHNSSQGCLSTAGGGRTPLFWGGSLLGVGAQRAGQATALRDGDTHAAGQDPAAPGTPNTAGSRGSPPPAAGAGAREMAERVGGWGEAEEEEEEEAAGLCGLGVRGQGAGCDSVCGCDRVCVCLYVRVYVGVCALVCVCVHVQGCVHTRAHPLPVPRVPAHACAG